MLPRLFVAVFDYDFASRLRGANGQILSPTHTRVLAHKVSKHKAPAHRDADSSLFFSSSRSLVSWQMARICVCWLDAAGSWRARANFPCSCRDDYSWASFEGSAAAFTAAAQIFMEISTSSGRFSLIRAARRKARSDDDSFVNTRLRRSRPSECSIKTHYAAL
jgi:hypothetical protein